MSEQSTDNEVSTTTTSERIEARLKRHPELKARIETLLSVVENAEGDLVKANAAEQRVVEEIQQLGQAALHPDGQADKIKCKAMTSFKPIPKRSEPEKKPLLVQSLRTHRSCRTTVYARQRQGDCPTV